ncbi:putative nuclease HARBI1 [Aplysia californica]|uniref:Nuclease HARBI1 n=1 Tax=Aplysia californica TaxID=6500 RepID=A0ABM0K2Q2_APLCA|nr:putative nuclease HARBI1 [Aplysia californica]
MAAPTEEPKTYITLKRKLSPQKTTFSQSAFPVETGDGQKQSSLSRSSAEYDTVVTGGMGSSPKKRLFVTVDADGNQVQVEVPHNTLPEGVNPDDASSYIVHAEDINLDLSSYSYSVVVDGIVEDVELNDCQYPEESVKLVKGDLKPVDIDSESDDHDAEDSKEDYILAEPEDADPLFKSHYRMSRIVASELMDKVGAHPKMIGRVQTLEQKVLASLFLLGNKTSYIVASDKYHMSKGSLYLTLKNFCQVLTEMRSDYIKWPTDQIGLRKIALEFDQETGMPGVVGAVDGIHFPIKQKSRLGHAYRNSQGYLSIHMQAVCDANFMFLDVHCGNPGSVDDETVYRSCDLRAKLLHDPLPADLHLVGDAGYPLEPFMLTPFPGDVRRLTRQQKEFNDRHTNAVLAVKISLQLLQGRFQRLKFLDMERESDIPVTIVACCVLHCFLLQEENDEEEEEFLDLSEIDPTPDINKSEKELRALCNHYQPEAASKRDVLANLITPV